MGTTQSVLLYGAEVWADALDMEMYRKRLAQLRRRGALRVASAYRTVSEPVVMVIVVAFLTKDRKAIYRRKGENLRKVVAREGHLGKMNQGADGQRGPSTSWLNRSHGEIYYFLILQSGHGSFQYYLHRIGKARSPDCVFCNGVADDAEHTLFSWERWDCFYQQLYADTEELSSDSIAREMLKSDGSWSRVAHYVRALLIANERMVRGSLN